MTFVSVIVVQRYTCWVGAVMLCFLVCFNSYQCSGEGGNKSAGEMLQAYENLFGRFAHFTFSYQMKMFVGDKFRREITGKILFDQTNIKHHRVETRYGNDQKSLYEDIIAPEFGTYFRVVRSAQNEPSIVSCYDAKNIPNFFQTLGPMNLLFGIFYFQEYKYLPDMLRELESDSITVTNNAEGQHEIRFILQEYQYQILLDVGTFSLVRFEKSALSKISEPQKTENYLIEVLAFESFEGVVFPSKFIVSILSAGGTIGDGDAKIQIPPTKARYEYSLTDISFNPLSEKDFQISMSLPNGTSVHMEDVPHIQHIWFNGNIVPKTNEVMLAIARGNHKFMHGPNEPRFWLMAFGILMIVVALGKMLYDIIQKNNQEKREGGQ